LINEVEGDSLCAAQRIPLNRCQYPRSSPGAATEAAETRLCWTPASRLVASALTTVDGPADDETVYPLTLERVTHQDTPAASARPARWSAGSLKDLERRLHRNRQPPHHLLASCRHAGEAHRFLLVKYADACRMASRFDCYRLGAFCEAAHEKRAKDTDNFVTE
jgi:hypothetical protein